MRDFLFFFGAALFLIGVALIKWPVALICLGTFMVYMALRMAESVNNRRPSHSVSKTDLNQN